MRDVTHNSCLAHLRDERRVLAQPSELVWATVGRGQGWQGHQETADPETSRRGPCL